MKNEKSTIVRLGLIFTGALLLYVGYASWLRGQIYVHFEVAVLCFISYLIGFSLIFLSLINYEKLIKLKHIEYLILASLIFALVFWSCVHLQISLTEYGTDSIAFSHYSAQLVLEGKNPYAHSMNPAFDRFGVPKQYVTPNTDGTTVDRTPYPAISFLIYAPFVGAGLSDMRWVTLLFQLLTIFIIFFKAPKILKPLILLPLFLPDMLEFTGGGVTDFLWVLPLVLMAIYIHNVRTAGVFYGIACSIKLTPVVLAPFLMIWYWKTSLSLHVKKRLIKIMEFVLISVIVFLIPNLIFILDNPNAWSLGALSPVFGEMVPYGQGLSNISQIGIIGLPQVFFTVCVGLVTLTLLVNYFVHFDRLKYAIWIFPAIILWFSYRGVQNYFIYWIPLAVTSMCLWYTETRENEKKTPMRRSAVHISRYKKFVTPVSLIACVSLIVASGFVFCVKEKLSVEVTGELEDTENIGAVSTLTVNVVNHGSSVVEPKFSVIGCTEGTIPFYWDVVSGPRYLESNSSATYIINAGIPQKAVPNDGVFVVRVNDAVSDVFFASKPTSVKL